MAYLKRILLIFLVLIVAGFFMLLPILAHRIYIGAMQKGYDAALIQIASVAEQKGTVDLNIGNGVLSLQLVKNGNEESIE